MTTAEPVADTGIRTVEGVNTGRTAEPNRTLTNVDAPNDASNPTAPRRDDDGTTFVEILVTIVLMGTVVVAVIGGLRGLVQASSVNADQARVEAVLVSASDRLRAAHYIPCPDLDGDYGHLSAAAAATVGWNSDQVDIIDIKYWDATAGGATNEADGDWSDSNSFVSGTTCQPDISLTTSRTLQKLVVQVSSPDGSIVRQIEVVKSPIVAGQDTP